MDYKCEKINCFMVKNTRKRKMKICHVTSAHNTDDVRIYKKECLSLAKRKNYEVFLVGEGKSITLNGVNVIGVGEKPKMRLKRMMFFASKTIRHALALDADLYHLHDPELLRYALRLKRAGKKVIFDSHENILDSIDEKVYMPLLIRKIAKFYYKILQQIVIKKSTELL